MANNKTVVLDDWMSVSVEGFAQQNAGRPPEHLIKELVQNSFDAIPVTGGRVDLVVARVAKSTFDITCDDNGKGIGDPLSIRTMFHTTKNDDRRLRGRMGRGFKELLCVSKETCVRSHGAKINFCVEGNRRKTIVVLPNKKDLAGESGTSITCRAKFDNDPQVSDLEAYFLRFLVPPTITFSVNGRDVGHRTPLLIVAATLPSEIFSGCSWTRPSCETTVRVVPLTKGESAQIYEMGIPVCDAEWSLPYHLDVQQRVPMNPNRDAVATGYIAKLHKAVLPYLVDKMRDEDARADWVGSVLPTCEPKVQTQILEKGFGRLDTLVRSTPAMGVYQYDEDAREKGLKVLDTRQTSSGFADVIRQHVPTSKQVIADIEQARVTAAATGTFDLEAAAKRTARQDELVTKAGGTERVSHILSFYRWFCQELINHYPYPPNVKVAVAILNEKVHPRSPHTWATWSEGSVVTFALDAGPFWQSPMGHESLATCIHEASHYMNMHHGTDFHKTLEELAGRAARIILDHHGHILAKWPDLIAV